MSELSIPKSKKEETSSITTNFFIGGLRIFGFISLVGSVVLVIAGMTNKDIVPITYYIEAFVSLVSFFVLLGIAQIIEQNNYLITNKDK